MNYLVGDVQGCAEPLQRLLQAAAFSPSRDHLVMLGDLVNRGPSSLATLQLLAGLGNAATCLLGNHDLHLLAVACGARKLHKQDGNKGDTFADVLQAPDSAHWLHWLRHQQLAHLQDGWLCVHAGVVPQWSPSLTLALASEVQTLLRGPSAPEFFNMMYSNEPNQWAEQLLAPDQDLLRARFVVNVLTRIRFCSEDGTLDFKTKEGAGAAPPGYAPWFEAPGRLTQSQPMAFGHWSTLGLVNRPNLLALDTGCVWGGALTAVRVDGGRRDVLQVPCGPAHALAQAPGT
jgi:bis(5'-nucleosyl)-tetraphosphatase (symmetrical)